MQKIKLFIGILVAASILGALIWALLPKPIEVDLAMAKRGPMEITVSAEGITKVRDKWAVTAPVAGNLRRSPVQVGDIVEKGVTVVATIEPAKPAFLDARARRLAEVSVQEAQAAVQLAEANLARANTELAHFETELKRITVLAERGTVSQTMLEDAKQMVLTARASRDVALYELEHRRATKQRMEVQLDAPTDASNNGQSEYCCLQIFAPQSGTVLSVTDMNARLTQAGATLLTIGDLSDLEIEVDLLSSDAVEVKNGAKAYIERWGGGAVLDARLRRIDPSAFSHISALGIAEQRVHLLLDFTNFDDKQHQLGDQYRVFARIVTWAADDVLQIPQSAIFRDEDKWAVFTYRDAKAHLTHIELDHMTGDWAEVLSGIGEGDQVITYPNAEIEHGTEILPRSAAEN